MNTKIFLICAIIFVAITTSSSLSSSQCPAASRIASCSPKCAEASGCKGAQVCCSNICGTKSCTDIYQYQDGRGGNDKYSSNSKQGATGTYCGNVKCNSGEKCEMDRVSKRQKCVRN